ncbi:metallophosphoesterase [Vibrio breoganii]|uniref:metallophosphoesterase n=1 Tax=Vibrio breoganii TaxID=553239 RepID=UPI0010553ED6|nr:metallophosphoesterase [Vibrio breoganii]
MKNSMQITSRDFRNVFIVTDVHGNYEVLMEGLKLAGHSAKKDALISLGDCIDRNNGSFNTLCHFLFAANTFSLRGNHEDAAVKGFCDFDRENYHLMIANGGTWTLNHDETALENIFKMVDEKFPVAIELVHNGKIIGLTHAGIPGGDFRELTKSNPDRVAQYSAMTQFEKALSQSDETFAERDFIKGASLCVHGHTIMPLSPKLAGNQLYLDTACQSADYLIDSIEPSAFLTILKFNEAGHAELLRIFRDDYSKIQIDTPFGHIEEQINALIQ